MTNTFLLSAQRAGLDTGAYGTPAGAKAHRFVLLDRDTNGQIGRAIFIDRALAAKFTHVEGNELELVLHKLKQLRATAGGANAYSNNANAMEHMTAIGSTLVTYRMVQHTHHSGIVPGVYITDIGIKTFGDSAPGLYGAKYSSARERWRVEAREADSIDSHFAAINGLCENKIQAATEILPPLLEKAYEAKKWQGNLQADGYSLFYNPPSLRYKRSIWTTPQQKGRDKTYAAGRLAAVLLDSQRRRRAVQWVVHSDGAHLLHAALQRAGGADLSQHTMLFLSPTMDVSAILPLIKKSKVNLHDDVMKTHDDDWLSKQTQMMHGSRLGRELRGYGFEEKAETLSTTLNNHRYDYAKGIGGALVGGFSLGSLLLNPALPSIAALAGTVWGAKETWEKAKSFRNTLANKSTNTSLNPHMHPFKDVAEMNSHAKRHHGNNTLQTFKAALLARVRD